MLHLANCVLIVGANSCIFLSIETGLVVDMGKKCKVDEMVGWITPGSASASEAIVGVGPRAEADQLSSLLRAIV